MESPLESARIVARWEQIVGPEVAAKCKPTSLRGGVLRIRTQSPAWAAEFRFLAVEVIARINTDAGRPIVREIKPWVGPPVEDNRGRRARGSTGVSNSTSRVDPGVLAEAHAVTETIGDEKVAAALRKALVAARNRQGKGAGMVQLEDIHCASEALSRSPNRSARQ